LEILSTALALAAISNSTTPPPRLIFTLKPEKAPNMDAYCYFKSVQYRKEASFKFLGFSLLIFKLITKLIIRTTGSIEG
jgi:hypothetical protein